MVHNRPSFTEINTDGLPFEVVEVHAPVELSGERSATAVRRRWLAGATAAELGEILGDLEAARLLCDLRKGREVKACLK